MMCSIQEFSVTANECSFVGTVNRECLPLVGLRDDSQEWQRYFARYVAKSLRVAEYEPGEGQVRTEWSTALPRPEEWAVRARVRMSAVGPDADLRYLISMLYYYPPAREVFGVRRVGPTAAP